MVSAACDVQIRLQVFGYCHARPSEVVSLIGSRHERDAVTLGGNFVLVATRGAETWVITSPYGVVPYFYSTGPGWFSHGPTVSDVLRQHQLEWRWNIEALADLLALEHLTGCQTLHAGVARTPPASVLHWDGRDLHRWSATWPEIHAPQSADGDPDQMVTALCDEVARSSGSAPVLSASAGFDSRVLLAALLASGKKPRLVVQGGPNSTDRLVVESIGRKFALPVVAVELKTSDYLSAADTICHATSGTKPANHWHTYLYTEKSALTRDDVFFVGANGEFARSYFLDKGAVSLAANCLPAHIALREFWKRKVKRTLTAQELAGVAPELADDLRGGRDNQIRRLAARRGGGRTLDQLDRFYLEERVRHFIGNGLALYGLSASWRTPFLSTAWVAAAEKLPRRWKLGSNWHRYAIARLCPTLLEFPEDHVAPRMSARHAPLYWMAFRRRQAVVPYVDYAKVFSDDRILVLLQDHAGELPGLIDERTIRAIIEDHRRSGRRRRAVSILLGCAIWHRLTRSPSAAVTVRPF